MLSTLIARSDRIQEANARDRRYLGTMIAAVRDDRDALYRVTGAVEGIDTLVGVLDRRT